MKIKKVLLNLAIIVCEVFVLRLCYGVVVDKIEPIKGVAIMLVPILGVVIFTMKSKDEGYRWVRPGLWKTTLLIGVILMAASLVGYNPFTFGW